MPHEIGRNHQMMTTVVITLNVVLPLSPTPSFWASQLIQLLVSSTLMPLMPSLGLSWVRGCPFFKPLPGLQVELTGHEDAAQAVIFDPAGQYLMSCGSDNTFRVWS